MRKLLLATVAAAALSLPAMAQNSANQSRQNPSQQQMTPSSPTRNGEQSGTTGSAVNDQSSQLNNQQAQNTVDPQQLSSHEIKQIQQSLDKQGFKSGHADGKWGPQAADAVKQFQQKEHMQITGKLDQQTLQALGVDMTAQGRNEQSSGASTTGQGSSEELSSPTATSGSGQNGAPSNQH
jgi:opacity protein-like surface antigen